MGYVVQKVSVTPDVTICDTHPNPAHRGKKLYSEGKKWTEYWGPISIDKAGYHRLPQGMLNLDTLAVDGSTHICTKGSVVITATAKVHMLPTKPQGFIVDTSGPAGSLPYVKDKHVNLDGEFSNTVSIEITVSWNCCNGASPTKVSRKGK